MVVVNKSLSKNVKFEIYWDKAHILDLFRIQVDRWEEVREKEQDDSPEILNMPNDQLKYEMSENI